MGAPQQDPLDETPPRRPQLRRLSAAPPFTFPRQLCPRRHPRHNPRRRFPRGAPCLDFLRSRSALWRWHATNRWQKTDAQKARVSRRAPPRCGTSPPSGVPMGNQWNLSMRHPPKRPPPWKPSMEPLHRVRPWDPSMGPFHRAIHGNPPWDPLHMTPPSDPSIAPLHRTPSIGSPPRDPFMGPLHGTLPSEPLYWSRSPSM